MRARLLPIVVAGWNLFGTARVLGGQAPQLSPTVRSFVTVDAPLVALTHVRLVDGTGAPPAEDQTIVIADGRIREVGSAASVGVPSAARVLDLTGHTILPGFVGMHDHTWYLVGGTVYQLQVSAPRLYLASGVTTTRTAGSLSPYAELDLKGLIDRGEAPGPRMYVTGPYIIGRGPDVVLDRVGMRQLAGADEARRVIAYWAEEGATWIKAYSQISRSLLGTTIEAAHARGLKVTAHLCSVTYREAADLGIDNLEHGLLTANDFYPGKEPDICPGGVGGPFGKVGAIALEDPAVAALIRHLVDKRVAMTSTIAVWELMVPGRGVPDPRTLEMMAPLIRQTYLESRRVIDATTNSPWGEYFKKALAFERRFALAGGLLAAGADPTGLGGALPGFANQRIFELLIEAGFTPVEAIRVMTSNGAVLLGQQQRIGTVAAGRLADLVVIRGDPVNRPADIRNVVTVFKDGVGYDSAKLIASVKGTVGLR